MLLCEVSHLLNCVEPSVLRRIYGYVTLPLRIFTRPCYVFFCHGLVWLCEQ